MSIAQQIMANPGRYSKEQLQSALNQGLVPAYIAIPLIEQKAKEAAAYRTAELAAQAPQQNAPTVAEEVLARANQPMGVPSLPTNLPEGYAPGGIVAFDDGGEVGMAEGGVVGYADRGLVSSMPNYQTSLDTMLERRAALIRRYQELENSGQAQVDEDRAGILSIPTDVVNNLTAPQRGLMSNVQTLREGFGRLGNIFTGKPTYATEGQLPRLVKAGRPPTELSTIEQQIKDLNTAIAQTEKQGGMPIQDNPMGLPAPAGPAAPAGGIDRLPAAPSMPNISTKLGRATNLITPEIEAQLKESRNPIYLDEATYVPKEKSVEEVAKGVKDLQTAFGVSEKPYEEQSARLGKREKDLEKRKAESVWDAVIRAGLATAAGTSQYALTNIAKGGLEGLQQYTSAREKLDESQERLDAARFSLADAQNRFRQEGSKEAGAELRENRRDVAQAKRDVAKDRVAAERQAQVLEREDVKNFLAELARVQTANLELAAKEIGFQIQKAGLDIQRFNAETQHFIANRPTEASFLIENAKRLFPNDPDKQTDYFVKQASAAASRASSSQGYTLQAKLQQEFSPGGGQYPEYKRIEKKEGRDAAEKFRRDWIAGEMGKQPTATGGGRAVSFDDLPN